MSMCRVHGSVGGMGKMGLDVCDGGGGGCGGCGYGGGGGDDGLQGGLETLRLWKRLRSRNFGLVEVCEVVVVVV